MCQKIKIEIIFHIPASRLRRVLVKRGSRSAGTRNFFGYCEGKKSESIYSIIPNPFLPQGETLLSDWPDELIERKSYRPRPIDPEILATMSVIEKIGYAPKPGK
mgnify:CR=1 FL=1